MSRLGCILLALVLVCLAVFVWPTPYEYHITYSNLSPRHKICVVKITRFTGEFTVEATIK